MTLDELNRMGEARFVATLGGVFEHSPWVAQRAFAARPFASVAALHAAMVAAVASFVRSLAEAVRASGYVGPIEVELSRHSSEAPAAARRSIDFLRATFM